MSPRNARQKTQVSAKREPRRECAAKEKRSDDAEGGLRVGVGGWI